MMRALRGLLEVEAADTMSNREVNTAKESEDPDKKRTETWNEWVRQLLITPDCTVPTWPDQGLASPGIDLGYKLLATYMSRETINPYRPSKPILPSQTL